MWELEIFDCGMSAGEMDWSAAPSVGAVLVDPAGIEMRVVEILAADAESKTAQVAIAYMV